MPRLRILHAIHDFLPRHRAGSEIYAHTLATEQSRRHDVWVLAAEFDPSATHGTLRWRRSGSLPVVELINNWTFHHFGDTYSSPRLNEQLTHVLAAVQPDVLHVHNLLNLSLDLPRLARERGIAVVATLHDYTLVCISGGQRVHRAERHVCDEIDPERCVRCFAQSPFALQLTAGRITASARMPKLLSIAARVGRALPSAAAAVRASTGAPATVDDVRRRLAYARHVFDMVDLFVAPSAAIGAEYVRLGIPPDRIEVSGYGHPIAAPVQPRSRSPRTRGVRIGYTGSIVWHKGLHVLIEAARGLQGEFEVNIHGDVNVDPTYAGELRSAAGDLPIRFAGAFDRDHVDDVYRTIDVLVVPSIWPENAPLVVQEARQYGIPVVASRIGGLPEFVRDAVDGRLFSPGSAGELRRILQSMIDDPSQVARLSAAPVEVKPIEVDAAEWERRYVRFAHLRADPDVERGADAAGAAGRDRSADQAS